MTPDDARNMAKQWWPARYLKRGMSRRNGLTITKWARVPASPKAEIIADCKIPNSDNSNILVVESYDRHGYPGRVYIFINGYQAEPCDMDLLYRDGGTRIIKTSIGTLVIPRKLSSKDRVPRWNGIPLWDLPREVVEEQRQRREALNKMLKHETGHHPFSEGLTMGLFQITPTRWSS